MTVPPSLVAILLMPWPPLRTANGGSAARAMASASATCRASPGNRTTAGAPVAVYTCRTAA